MRATYSRQFLREIDRLPLDIQIRFEKQLLLLLNDLRHPSLHAKKFNEGLDLWQARVDRDVRFYFTISGDTYKLVSIRRHPK